MRCGYKSVFIVTLIAVDVASLAGDILNLVWINAELEQRQWLAWALLIASGLALVFSVLVGVFHWLRIRDKRRAESFESIPLGEEAGGSKKKKNNNHDGQMWLDDVGSNDFH